MEAPQIFAFQSSQRWRNPRQRHRTGVAGNSLRSFCGGKGSSRAEPNDVGSLRDRARTIFLKNGAARGIRTPDPVITNDVLYRLSYCGVKAFLFAYLRVFLTPTPQDVRATDTGHGLDWQGKRFPPNDLARAG
jgi:hypothetical protein